MEWNRLKTFYYVAVCQSFTKASQSLNISQPALSTSIGLLEAQVNTTLFIRRHAGITLTRAGEKLFDAVKPFFETLNKVKDDLLEDYKEPKGELHLLVNHSFLTFYLAPYFANFLEQYPDISLRILASDDFPNFELGQADIGLCTALPHNKAIIQKHVIAAHVVLYASPTYLEKYGTPETPEDLDHHRLISIGNFAQFDNMNWHLKLGRPEGEERTPYMVINPPQCRLMMAQQGLGIIAISKEHPGLDQLGLIQVLPHIPGPVIKTYLMYPTYLKESRKIKVFEEFVLKLFETYR